MESDADQLIEKLQRAYVRIKWLEDELLRLKMLLAGDDSMCNFYLINECNHLLYHIELH